MTIVTAPNGTRYRHSGNWKTVIEPGEVYDASGNGRGILFYAPPPDYHAEAIALKEPREIMKPLPPIPDWPLPDKAPQYLAEAPFTSKKGDWVALRDSNDDWLVYRPIAGSKFRAGKSVYLVSRADPTEDA